MGNSQSQSHTKTEELKQFHRQILGVYETKLHSKKELAAEDLEQLFPNRVEFCRRFAAWMRKLSYKGTANRESFIFACEVMLLDSDMILKEEYKNHSFNFLELFMHMTMAKYPNEIETLSKADVLAFIKTLVNLFLDDTQESSLAVDVLDKMTLKLFTVSEEVHLESFIRLFKDNLTTSITFGKRQLEHLLFAEPLPQTPRVKEGYVLNNQILMLLGLTNSKIFNRDRIDLLYSSRSMGNSFHRLTGALKGYDAPVIVLIKNQFDLIGAPDCTSIFGFYANCLWADSLSYFGNADTYLFKITPDFKTFYSFNGKGGKDFLYLNTKQISNSVYRSGLGVGGGVKSKARIWLDYELMTRSYAEDTDLTFERGVLTQSPYDYLRIEQVEIWGFPSKDTQTKQEMFKQQENEAIISSRKIDKKELFNQPGNEFLMESKFKFKEQLHIDFEHEKGKLDKQ